MISLEFYSTKQGAAYSTINFNTVTGRLFPLCFNLETRTNPVIERQH